MSSRLLWAVVLSVVLVVAIAVSSRWSDDGGRTVTDVRSVPSPLAEANDGHSTEQAPAVDGTPDEPPPAEEYTRAPEQQSPSQVFVPLQGDRPTLSAEAFFQQPAIKALLEEPRDPEWSADMERRILGEISEWKGIPFLSLQADCRTSFCLVTVVHPRGTDSNQPLRDAEWLLHAFDMGPRPFYMGKGPGDTVEGWLFLGRVTAPRPTPPPLVAQ